MPGRLHNFEGFAYIDISNPMAAWNVVRGSFFSPSCLPGEKEKSQTLSFAMATLLHLCNKDRCNSELQLEHFRRTYFPAAVSRLTGFFVFDSISSVERLWDDNLWGGHFRDEYLTDVGVSADFSTRMDAQWISMMMNKDCQLVENWEEMAQKYWAGNPANANPIWECVVEGWLTVWGLDLKQRALREIQAHWPRSLTLLSYSANAALLGSCDGSIFPLVTRIGSNIDISYYARLVDAKNEKFLKRLEGLVKSDNPNVCRYSGDVELVTADFSMYSFKRKSNLAGILL